MASSKGSQNVRNYIYSGKHALLPPKIPFPSVSASHTDYIPSGLIGSKAVQKSREEKPQHQRTSSESHLMVEQPFWLDDLLNEPESPVRRSGHRRSSSDSFAYLDMANASNTSYTRRGIREFDHNKNVQDVLIYANANLLKQKNRLWDSSVMSGAQPSCLPSSRENITWQNSGPTYTPQEADRFSYSPTEMKNATEALYHNPAKVSFEKKNSSPKLTTSEADNTKRAKQQIAQRSRVRKLQYIAELERNVQALQAEGSEVSAELEFLNQQNLIMSMENKALKQRLESLSQEKLIKHLEQEVLEREIGRLRALYQQQQEQQQQQPQKASSNHRNASNKDLDSQFANLSLKSKDSNSSYDPVDVMGQFQI